MHNYIIESMDTIATEYPFVYYQESSKHYEILYYNKNFNGDILINKYSPNLKLWRSIIIIII